MKHRLKMPLAATSALLLVTGAGDVWACGGLFCNASEPVEQTAERILFADNGDGKTTAIIEIQYQGPAEKFAWLLPVPGVPVVSVSSTELFNALDRATNPIYQTERNWGDCGAPEYSGDDSADDDASDDEGDDGGIQVLDQGLAGPYQYVTIGANPELDDPAAAAIKWLQDNDYDVGPLGPSVLNPYLAEGANLIAFRLAKGQDAGSIRPVQLVYEGAPTIPIRPTAVAAADDMAIRVYVLGASRSVSQNYLTVELNDARIDWSPWQDGYDASYTALVSAAVDEAGGQAFVTEMAEETKRFENLLWTPYQEDTWQRLRQSTQTGVNLLMSATEFRWFSAEGFRRAVEAAVTLSGGVTLDEFGADPFSYEQQATVDDAAFLRAIKQEIVKPARDAQALVDGNAFISRLFTTLSPLEMGVDPVFEFYPDLQPVDPVRTAEAILLCDETVETYRADFSLITPTGFIVPGRSPRGNPELPEELDELPAARRILSQGSEVLEDRTAAIHAALADITAELGRGDDAERREAALDGIPIDRQVDDGDDFGDDDSLEEDSADDDSADDDSADDDSADDDSADDDSADDDSASDDSSSDDDASDDSASDDDASDDDASDDDASDDDASDDDEGGSDDDGCSVAAPAAPRGGAWGWILAGMAAALTRRRASSVSGTRVPR